MPDCTGEMIALAFGVAFSPIPIAALILVLSTPGGVRNGFAYLVGWALGLLFLVSFVTFLAIEADPTVAERRRLVGAWINLGFGIFLLLMSVRSWRKRAATEEVQETPRWMQRLDQFGLFSSLVLGMLLGVANLKNVPLSVQASLLVAREVESFGERGFLVTVFLVLSSLGVALPVLITLFGGEKPERILQQWKQWLSRHNTLILTILFALIGSWLIAKAIAVLYF